jgi:hypothetical protein
MMDMPRLMPCVVRRNIVIVAAVPHDSTGIVVPVAGVMIDMTRRAVVRTVVVHRDATVPSTIIAAVPTVIVIEAAAISNSD